MDLKAVNLIAEGIERFRFSHEKGLVQPLRVFPPPAFSLTLQPLDYDYKQNPAVFKVKVRGENVRTSSLLKILKSG